MKITINYDTTEKTMSVKMGATVLEDVSGIYVYPKWDDDGKFSLEVSQVTRNEKDDTVTVIRTMASKDGEVWDEQVKAVASQIVENLGGFREVSNDPAKQQELSESLAKALLPSKS